MTTNHIERLDPVRTRTRAVSMTYPCAYCACSRVTRPLRHQALIRPGRVDLSLKFDLATAMQAKGMFLRFFPTEVRAEAM
jgi:hypothetical protein